jgi:pimeloyl-ACP methyl ester carboxylesterase
MLLQDIREINLTVEAGKFRFLFSWPTGDSIWMSLRRLHLISMRIPSSLFYVFETSGHPPFYEQPEEFVRIVELFLDGRPLSSAESAAHSPDRTSHRPCL